MKTFSILIGAGLALALAGCAGGSRVERVKFTMGKPTVYVDNRVRGIYSCHTLLKYTGEKETRVYLSPLKFKVGDLICPYRYARYGTGGFRVIQTRENKFSITSTTSGPDGALSEQGAEEQILLLAAVVGRAYGFKYGVFDDAERSVDRQSGDVESTTQGTGWQVSRYGITFGRKRATTTVETTPGSVSVRRRHTVTFYKDNPNFDGAFDVGLMLKSLNAESHVWGSGPEHGKEIWPGEWRIPKTGL